MLILFRLHLWTWSSASISFHPSWTLVHEHSTNYSLFFFFNLWGSFTSYSLYIINEFSLSHTDFLYASIRVCVFYFNMYCSIIVLIHSQCFINLRAGFESIELKITIERKLELYPVSHRVYTQRMEKKNNTEERICSILQRQRTIHT